MAIHTPSNEHFHGDDAMPKGNRSSAIIVCVISSLSVVLAGWAWGD
jgi:hypothetical protein